MTQQVIWKFPAEAAAEFELSLPIDAQLLAVQLQAGQPCLWVQLDPTKPRHPRRFFVRPTGQEWCERSADPQLISMKGPDGEEVPRTRYVGTFQPESEPLVFHLYEEIA